MRGPAGQPISTTTAGRAADARVSDEGDGPTADPWRPAKARGPDVVINDPAIPAAVVIPPGATWVRSAGPVAVSLHGSGVSARLDGRPMEPGRIYVISGDWLIETDSGAGLHFRPPVPGDPAPQGRG